MPPLMPPSSGASGSSLQEPSANWLIDAMSEQRHSRSSASDSDVRERVRGAQSPVRRFTKPRDDSANGASGEHRASRGFVGRLDEATGLDSVERTPASTPNPLAPYLSSWLAPREYARLQSALDRPGEIVSPVSPAPSPGNLEVGVVALPGRNQLPRMPASIGYKPLENPYLQAMLPSAVPGRPSSASPSAPVVARPLSPKVEDLPPQAPPQSAIPPFVKPLSEERYFKPLKRF